MQPGSGFKIGRIFGINIRIAWSWLLIFLLISWNLGAFFGQTHPDWSSGLQWGIAIIAALLFFASVLAHELAHSLMAQARGVSVRSITLFLFGGVSNIQKEPESPQSEFLITIVGPLTSIVLGVVFILLGSAMGGLRNISLAGGANALSQLGPVNTVLFWLGPINLVLGIFNLIPGFPLDGGRLLRSLLWAGTDNLRQATRWASRVGQAIAWLMIFTGVAIIFGANIPFFGSDFISGIWLAFIGWFLNSASIQSYRQVVIRDLLEDVPVQRMMRDDPPTATADSNVSNLVHERMMKSDEHAFPVVENGRLTGLVTLEDIRQVDKDDWDHTRVRDVMTPAADLVTVTAEADAADAMQKLQRRDVRQLPVTAGDELRGVLRRRDIMKWLQLQADEQL
jgi:Zn-dependent protease